MDNKTIDTVVKILTYSKDRVEETEPAIREELHKCGRDIFESIIKYELAAVKASEEVTFITNPGRHNHLIKLKLWLMKYLRVATVFLSKIWISQDLTL